MIVWAEALLLLNQGVINMRKILIFIFCTTISSMSFCAAPQQCVVPYDSQLAQNSFVNVNEVYSGVPEALSKNTQLATKLATTIQPWNGQCASCTLKDSALCAKLPCQTANIKAGGVYDGIEVKSNKWMQLANEVAHENQKKGGGPFGAVAVQIDDKTGRVIRYWQGYNHVVVWHDPTAHAEMVTIREASHDLGVFDLGHIRKEDSRLPQPNEMSHIELYSSAEPCPMCMSAIYWARIPVLVFSATRYDAAQQGVGFSDEAIYRELALPYNQRKEMKVYQATTDNSLGAFNTWKRTDHTNY